MSKKDNSLRWYKLTYTCLGGFSRAASSWKAARSEKEATDYLKKSVKFPHKVVKVETEEFEL